ncbi:gp49 [Bacillus phage W.Ph.]|uniref:Gp49 n=1 Tax=Bacillus phage W.Ph. TaxID=764595 RepID=G9B1F0_9CAUD|nr:gp49 [Bacillus phage W.Ph.]ADH03195.1 gp49 [Bacillus phage W.Ph.]
MSRMDELKKREQHLKEKLQMHIGDGHYHYAEHVIKELQENEGDIINEESQQLTPLCDELSFDDLRVGDKFREESSSTYSDGIYYYHEVLYITKTPDSSGTRTAFTRVSYENEFWYSTVDEDYFK